MHHLRAADAAALVPVAGLLRVLLPRSPWKRPMSSRGRRTQRRAAERREEKAERRKRLALQLSYRPKKRKIKNEGK